MTDGLLNTEYFGVALGANDVLAVLEEEEEETFDRVFLCDERSIFM